MLGDVVRDCRLSGPLRITAPGDMAEASFGISLRRPPMSSALPIGTPSALTCVSR